MPSLTKKQLRVVSGTITRFFSVNAFETSNEWRKLGVEDFFLRRLELTGNRQLYLTDMGMDQFRALVTALHDGDVSDGLAEYSDIWNMCKQVVEDLMSRNLRPEDATEFIGLVTEQVKAKTDEYTFVVPIVGIELEEVEELKLGSMKVVAASVSFLNAAGIKHDHANIQKIINVTDQRLWLVGSTRGTLKVATEKFRSKAELAVGLLAAHAAAHYKGGASGFRIGIVMKPEHSYTRATWMCWSASERELQTTYHFGASQNLKIGSELAKQLSEEPLYPAAFRVFEAENRSELEERIARGVFWFADAHREPITVMKLIKYWSCVETFFSQSTGITKSVSVGLASVLVFGGCQFVPEAQYRPLKKRITKLYGFRCSAVHAAEHEHVSERDVSDLSQWAAWLLICMVSFVERGYTTLAEIREQCIRLDATTDLSSKNPINPS